jgi:hypothetical protein
MERKQRAVKEDVKQREHRNDVSISVRKKSAIRIPCWTSINTDIDIDVVQIIM